MGPAADSLNQALHFSRSPCHYLFNYNFGWIHGGFQASKCVPAAGRVCKTTKSPVWFLFSFSFLFFLASATDQRQDMPDTSKTAVTSPLPSLLL